MTWPISCSSPEQKSNKKKNTKKEQHDLVLEKILKTGKLVASTDYNSTNYFVYRGEPMGYQYELLKSFSDYLGVKLDIKIINDLDESFSCINDDECDLLAVGLTVTKERSKLIDFSNPLSQTRQMLVQRKPENWRKMATMDQIEGLLIRDPIKLAGKTIHVQKKSTFLSRLNSLSNEIGADIIVIEHPDATVEELISMVAEGEIEFTICDEYIGLVNNKFYPDIDVKTPISFSQNIAWAVKKGSGKLVDTINDWLNEFNKSKTYAFIYNKYFRNSRTVNIASSEYNSVTGGKISPYDQIIREYSKWIEWDWRLLASLIYQESQFYPEAKSWAGAYGLMQLMPHTAEKYGVDSLSPPEDQIRAGVQFIRLLDKQFVDKIEDKEERTKFVLASYNAGIAHVYDARRLAEKYEKDPNRWEKNVDYYLLNKSKPEYYNDSVVKYGYCRGTEPYNFVYDILERYEHYKNTIVN
ncbi:MAG: transporter substrate-binding domain-containing protein [Bacteroidales bacterium]